ncbi:MAG: peptide chain release factor N(5)-glutamine methyltransferase [Candidatus Nanopelagicales bacterium]
MSTIRDILVDSQRRLSNAGIESASTESAELLAHVLGVPRNRLLMQDSIDGKDRVAFERLLAKRLNRIPLQHITGTAPFRRIELKVGPGVFIPRPESELVAEAAIRFLRECENPIAVDLCSGSGAIALSLALEVPGARVVGVELSADSFVWLQQNVNRFDCEIPVEIHQVDATDFTASVFFELAGKCDVVTCNPPYIPIDMTPRDPEVRIHEPAVALYGGSDGLDVIRGIASTAAVLLKSGGLLVVEHADVQGAEAGDASVVNLLKRAHLDEELVTYGRGILGEPVFAEVTDRLDFNQRPRFSMATRV